MNSQKNRELDLIGVVKQGNPKNFKIEDFMSDTKTVAVAIPVEETDDMLCIDDIFAETEPTLKDKLDNLRTLIAAKIQMHSTKKESERTATVFSELINMDFSEEGIRKYRENQLREILVLIDQLNRYHKRGTIESTTKNINVIDKWLRILPKIEKNPEHLNIYMEKLTSLKHNLVEWLFELNIERANQYQKAR